MRPRTRWAWRALTLLAAVLVAWPACADEPILAAPVPLTPDPPQIDGVLDDPCWERAVPLAEFMKVGSHAPASQPTVVRVVRDRRALYVAFECYEPLIDHLARDHTGHDAEVWFDDSVELFIDPTHSHQRYYQFAVNCVGARFDRHMEDIDWTAPWRAATHIGEDRWSVEVAVPFATLGVRPPQPGDVFAANFCRNRKASSPESAMHGEWSNWAPTQSQYHEPERFGHLIFTDADVAEVPASALRELAESPLCARGLPMSRPVRLILPRGVMEYQPYVAMARASLAEAESAPRRTLDEVEKLLARPCPLDPELRDALLARFNELADQAILLLRDVMSEGVDAAQLQELKATLADLQSQAEELLWEVRFELLFAEVTSGR
ncbi:MAG: carbohydrate-binding family 9-like protein [Armatimonadota bacterium]|nr:carbohydrate-binding family 9-like protein [Armatimonadota bacterium]